MRALPLCGLTLAVAAAHLAAWRLAAADAPGFRPARAGVRWIRPVRAVAAREVGRVAPGAPAVAGAALSAKTSASLTPAAPIVAARQARQAATRDAGDPTPRTASRILPATFVAGWPARSGTTAAAATTTMSMSTTANARPLASTSAPNTQVRDSPPATSPRPPGERGAAKRPAARPQAWPVYPTQPPPAAVLHYALRQGGYRAGPPEASGHAEIAWSRDAAAFGLRVATFATGHPAREWRSTGGFDTAGVAPERLVERERGRDGRTVDFDRDARLARFSGASPPLALAPGAQDRWSWIAQLAAIAEAASRGGRAPVVPGTTWTLQVAGLRGALDRWVFRVQPGAAPPPAAGSREGNDLSDPTSRASLLLHLVREPERPYDLRIEAWLSPALHHLPVALRLAAPPGAWWLSLRLSSDAAPDDAAGS